MSICTDCILSRLTIINVEQADLGNYYIEAITSEFPSELGRITLYRTCLVSVEHRHGFLLFQKRRIVNNSSPIEITKVANAFTLNSRMVPDFAGNIPSSLFWALFCSSNCIFFFFNNITRRRSTLIISLREQNELLLLLLGAIVKQKYNRQNAARSNKRNV